MSAADLIDTLDTQTGAQYGFDFRERRPDPIPVRRRNYQPGPERICLLTIKTPLDTGVAQPKPTVDLSPSDLRQGRARATAKRRAKSSPFN